MDVEVLDNDLAAAGAQFAGQEFGESGCPFRDYELVLGCTSCRAQAASRFRPPLPVPGCNVFIGGRAGR